MTRTHFNRSIPALVLGYTLGLFIAAPAAGASCTSERPASPVTAVQEALACFWNGLVGQRTAPADPYGPAPFTADDETDGHPHMDPNGLTGPPSSGTGGPHMDPNGPTAEHAGSSNGYPEMEPDGASAAPGFSEGHPHMDPDG